MRLSKIWSATMSIAMVTVLTTVAVLAHAKTSAVCLATCTGKPNLTVTGPGLHHAEVVPVFWGLSKWPTGQTPNQYQIIGSVQAILNGPYLGALRQYNNIGPARMVPFAPIVNTAVPNNFKGTDFTGMITSAIDNGTLPVPSAFVSTVYAIFIPANLTSTNIPNANGFNGGGNYKGINYTWLYVSGANTLTGGNSYSAIFSHEIAEAVSGVGVTNCSAPGQPGTNNQLADLCQCLNEDQLGGQMTVLGYWSAIDGGGECVIPEAWHNVHQYNGTPNNWTTIGPDVRQIYAGPAGLVATDGSDNLIQYSGTPGQWSTIGQPGAMFAVGQNGVIGLHPDGQGVSQFQNGAWTQIGGPATAIYAGFGTNVLATDYSGSPYRYNGAPFQWTRIGQRGAQFAIGNAIVFGLTPDHTAVMAWQGGTQWQQEGGSASEIFGGGLSPGLLAQLSLDAAQGVQIVPIPFQSPFLPAIPQGGPGMMFAVTGAMGATDSLFGLTPSGSGVWQSGNTGTANPQWTNVGGLAGRLVGGGSSLYATEDVVF